MTSRHRVKSAINKMGPDRIPVHEELWTGTLDCWKEQGVPEVITFYPPVSEKESLDNWYEDYFDFDIAVMYLDASPRFDQKILNHEVPFIRKPACDSPKWQEMKDRQ